jgi:ankyrin repeat protein
MKKIVVHAILCIGFFGFMLKSIDLDNQFNRTALIDLVIERELQISKMVTKLKAVFKEKSYSDYFLERNILDLIHDTIFKIKELVARGVDINAKDCYGKTVLNYCYTYAIYQKLLYLGADFQYTVWIYFNQTTILYRALGVFMTGIVGREMYIQYHDKKYY